MFWDPLGSCRWAKKVTNFLKIVKNVLPIVLNSPSGSSGSPPLHSDGWVGGGTSFSTCRSSRCFAHDSTKFNYVFDVFLKMNFVKNPAQGAEITKIAKNSVFWPSEGPFQPIHREI